MLFIPDKVRRRLLIERDRQFHSSVTVRDRIKAVGLRPTKQRIALGEILFRGHQGHTTAEQLHRQSIKSGVRLSLATVYNTLNQFADAGLLSKVNLDGEQSYFDINISDHHHFYIETQDLLIDIPADELTFGKLPSPPEGYRISKIDVLIGLEPISATGFPGQLSSECAACSECCSSPKLQPRNEKGPRP